jgi:hypothetical protein
MRDIIKRAKDSNPGIDVLVLFLVEWSDDYDPSVSVNDGRSLCHCKSTYIAPHHGRENGSDGEWKDPLARHTA